MIISFDPGPGPSQVAGSALLLSEDSVLDDLYDEPSVSLGELALAKPPPAVTEEMIDVDLEEDLANYKETAIMADSRADAAELANHKLADEITQLKVKLQSSLDEQKKYMVAGDKANTAVQSLNIDTADHVLKALEEC